MGFQEIVFYSKMQKELNLGRVFQMTRYFLVSLAMVLIGLGSVVVDRFYGVSPFPSGALAGGGVALVLVGFCSAAAILKMVVARDRDARTNRVNEETRT